MQTLDVAQEYSSYAPSPHRQQHIAPACMKPGNVAAQAGSLQVDVILTLSYSLIFARQRLILFLAMQ